MKTTKGCGEYNKGFKHHCFHEKLIKHYYFHVRVLFDRLSHSILALTVKTS